MLIYPTNAYLSNKASAKDEAMAEEKEEEPQANLLQRQPIGNLRRFKTFTEKWP